MLIPPATSATIHVPGSTWSIDVICRGSSQLSAVA
jgi:hypothetical protein